nr:hypothetical protein [Ilumatobacter sp.]
PRIVSRVFRELPTNMNHHDPDTHESSQLASPDSNPGLALTDICEVPKAFVTVLPGVSVTIEELQELIAEHLVSYKQIKRLEVVDAIPKSAAGKILRKELRLR